MGLLERHGKDGTRRSAPKSCQNGRKRASAGPTSRENVEPGATVYTDALTSYDGLERPSTSTRSSTTPKRYVDGNVHTNGLENFWSLLKRGHQGHLRLRRAVPLFRYLDEQAFRFNEPQARARRRRSGSRTSSISGWPAAHVCGLDRIGRRGRGNGLGREGGGERYNCRERPMATIRTKKKIGKTTVNAKVSHGGGRAVQIDKTGGSSVATFDSIRVLITKEDDAWLAQGLDIDYATDGDSLADVSDRGRPSDDGRCQLAGAWQHWSIAACCAPRRVGLFHKRHSCANASAGLPS